MPTLGWMGLSFSTIGEDPLKNMDTFSMQSALEGLELQLENKGGEDGRAWPWDENALSLVGMTRGPPTHYYKSMVFLLLTLWLKWLYNHDIDKVLIWSD